MVKRDTKGRSIVGSVDSQHRGSSFRSCCVESACAQSIPLGFPPVLQFSSRHVGQVNRKLWSVHRCECFSWILPDLSRSFFLLPVACKDTLQRPTYKIEPKRNRRGWIDGWTPYWEALILYGTLSLIMTMLRTVSRSCDGQDKGKDWCSCFQPQTSSVTRSQTVLLWIFYPLNTLNYHQFVLPAFQTWILYCVCVCVGVSAWNTAAFISEATMCTCLGWVILYFTDAYPQNSPRLLA